jgi:hypothetical protein
MDERQPDEKSCTVQHFVTGCPDVEWTIEELSVYAQAQHEALIEDEQKLTVRYWRLGVALNLLRRNFDRGQWERLLCNLRIEKTKASRARSIARTFATEKDVAGLTVRQAYDKRVRKRRPANSGRSPPSELREFDQLLAYVVKTADELVDTAGFAAAADAVARLPAVDAAIAKLEQVRTYLRQQANLSRNGT